MSKTQRDIEVITAWIKKEEGGFRAAPYTCPSGYRTVGFGHNLTASGRPEQVIDLHVALQWFDEDLRNAVRIAEVFSGYSGCNQIRRGVLIAMAYQMGNSLHSFKRTEYHLTYKEYHEAAREMLRSRWAIEQTPPRAWRTAYIMAMGTVRSVENVMKML